MSKWTAGWARRGADWDGVPDEAIFERDQWQCQMPRCLHPDGRSLTRGLPPGDPWAATIDHMTRRSTGGTDTAENKRAAHRECNNRAAALADRARDRVARRQAILACIAARPGCTVGTIRTVTGLPPSRIWLALRDAERDEVVRGERASRSDSWHWTITEASRARHSGPDGGV